MRRSSKHGAAMRALMPSMVWFLMIAGQPVQSFPDYSPSQNGMTKDGGKEACAAAAQAVREQLHLLAYCEDRW